MLQVTVVGLVFHGFAMREVIMTPEKITFDYVMQFSDCFYASVKSPVWANSEKTAIFCQVNFSHVNFEEFTPFCADPLDYMPYSKQIFDECLANKWGPIGDYVAPVEAIPQNADGVSQ